MDWFFLFWFFMEDWLKLIGLCSQFVIYGDNQFQFHVEIVKEFGIN